MPDFTIKRNDTSPALEYQLQDDGENAIDITGFSEVSFLMRKMAASTLSIDDDTSGNVSVTDASSGLVRYNWQAADTSTAGEFEAEWEVEYSDGSVETFPNTGFIDIEINRDLST